MTATEITRSGFIAVAGRPNAGKSTLVNRIVGQHVAIVSPIAQTTRRVVRAAVQVDDAQLVFVDLPGSQKPVDRLTERMQRSVEHSFDDVDMVLWVIDGAVPLGAGERRVADMVFASGLPVVVVLNKVDMSKPTQTIERITAIDEIIAGREYESLVPVSALTGDGVDTLLKQIAGRLPEGPAWFGDEDITDMRAEERIAEYVREAMLGRLRDELPHATVVTVDEMVDDDENGQTIAVCTIWVERDSQVGIVVGKQGAGIKEVGILARERIERELGLRLHLELRVKVRRKWRDDESWLARAGL